MEQTQAPGWYQDPNGSAAKRFWNGSGWTDELMGVQRMDPAQFARIERLLASINTSVMVLAAIAVLSVVGGMLVLLSAN